MTWDNDYAYIGVFIDFLERIVDIFIKLLYAIRGKPLPEKPTDDTTKPSETPVP